MTLVLLRRKALHLGILTLVVSFVGFYATADAKGKTKTFAAGPIFCSSVGQLCNPAATIALAIPGPGGAGEGQFAPGPLACSDVRIHFFIDGTEVAVTDFVGPGGTTAFVSLGVIGHGNHTLGAQAEGEVGGCNIGNLLSWAGTVTLRKAP